MYAQKWVNSLGQVRWQPVLEGMELLNHGRGYGRRLTFVDAPASKALPQLYWSRRWAQFIGWIGKLSHDLDRDEAAKARAKRYRRA